jgi:Ion channel
MSYIVIFMVCFALVVATTLIHYEVLRGASALAPRLAIPARPRTLLTIAAAFFAHSIQIWLYAFAYWACTRLGLGQLVGAAEGHFYDYFYFSAATFTTLGLGDVVVEGPLRLLTGVESLNGLVLITWSASFTYLSMEKFWLNRR